MKSKNMLAVACIAALGSSIGIVHGQEQDESSGTVVVTSIPPESGGNGLVEIEENKTHGYSGSIVEASLQDELDQIKNNGTIEVIIYLDSSVSDEEDSYFGVSGSATYSSDSNGLSDTRITTSDPELDYAIEGLSFEEKVAIVEERRTQIDERKLTRRIEKSQKTVEQLLKKIGKKKFDRLISFNEDAGIIKAVLRKNEIEKLARHPEYIRAITLNHEMKNKLSGAFSELKLNTTSFPVRNYGGDNVGIYMVEGAGNYCFDTNKVKPIENTIGLGGGNYYPTLPSARFGDDYRHGERVAQSLRAASPHADIFCSSEEEVPSAWRNKIHIANYSWGGSTSTNQWDRFSEALDNYIYNSGVLVVAAAGNDCDISLRSCYVNTPGTSHNALTVGAYDHRSQKMAHSSAWRNPSTGATKPEILAPGVDLHFAANQGTASGTSFATPLAAGMAASFLSKVPMMKKHAAAIKASMIAMATKNNIRSNGNSQPNGANGIRWNPDGKASWWDEPNSYLNDADGKWKQIESVVLRKGENARIALSWLNRADVCDGKGKYGTYTPQSHRLCMGLALKVVDPNNKQVVFQNIQNRNWQAQNFYVSTSGAYKVYVYRYRNSYEWDQRWWWSDKSYSYNDVKMGMRIVYIDNW